MNDRAIETKKAISQMFPWIFRKLDLRRDVIIGLIGERGAGKSVGAAAIAFHDYMVVDEPCWSNTKIKADIAGVIYESLPLDMKRLLYGDLECHGGVIIVDEGNMTMADGRRAMANQNIAADDIAQQLRKMNSALIYTCLSEGFMDLRIRENTDIFITCRDNKFNPTNTKKKIQLQGELSDWEIHGQTDKGIYILNGQRNKYSGECVIRKRFKTSYYWGLINTDDKLKRTRVVNNQINSNAVDSDNDNWIVDKIGELLKSKVTLLSPSDYTDIFEQPTLTERRIISGYGIIYNRKLVGYPIDKKLIKQRLGVYVNQQSAI